MVAPTQKEEERPTVPVVKNMEERLAMVPQGKSEKIELGKMTPQKTMRKDAKTAATETERNTTILFRNAAEFYKGTLEQTSEGKKFLSKVNDTTEIGNLVLSGKIPMEKLFKNCKVQYGYDNKEKIYSVMVMLDNRPRILTLRVGDNYTEMAIADMAGNVKEMLRQEGKNITLNVVK